MKIDSELRQSLDVEPIHDSPTGIFALTGEYWTIGYGGTSCSLRDTLGLNYLQQLLQHPGEEFHALDLLMGSAKILQEGANPNELATLKNEGFIPSRPGDLGPMLDARAKQEFKRRRDELREELEELRERGAYERAEAVNAEIEAISRELVHALGLGGRDRRAGSAAERARINVTRAIRTAIQRISEHHSALGKLLDQSVRTGSFCRYLQDPKVQINWSFSTGFPIYAEHAAPATMFSFGKRELLEEVPEKTMFVGRTTERATLRECLQRTMNGQGAMILIGGPPGIGKTRLSREIGSEARRSNFVTLSGNCYDREDSVLFIPLVEMLEGALSKAPTLESFRDSLGDQAVEFTRLMPQLHRLFPNIPPTLQVSPEQARRALFNAVVELIARQSRTAPMLLLFEDVHWADEGTLALLTHLARAISHLPVMVMMTYRDDAMDPVSPFAKTIDDLIRLRIDEIQLRGLPQTAVSEMLKTLSGQEQSASLVRRFYANTEGNPLFVEELFYNLQRNNSNDSALEGQELDELALPSSLRVIIGRRLARVSKETQKMLATASVIGRSFTFTLLENATRVEASRLIELVEEAEKAGLISSKLRYPDVQFKFAHELIRRAVLDDLSIARRQRFHLDVASAIEQLDPNILDYYAEDLAHHLWNAGVAAETGKTIRYLQIAGAKAVQNLANIEAIGHFRRALQLINSEPDSSERAHTELMLQVALTIPLITTKGFASPEVETVYARARHLSRQAGEAPQLFTVLWGMWLFHTARAEHITARDIAGQCLQLAEKAGNPVPLLAAHHALGVSLSTLADFDASLEHLEHTIKLYNPDQHAGLAFQYGQDFGVVARSHAAVNLWYLGFPERAGEMTNEALSLARKLPHPHTLVGALLIAARIDSLSRDVQATRARAEEALKLAAEGEFGFWRPVANIYRGWAIAQEGKIEEGIAQMREGLDAYRASGSGVARPSFLASLAEVYGRAGQMTEGLGVLSEAYATITQSGERWSEPELYRIEGDLRLMLAETQRSQSNQQKKKAEECYLRAIEIAREQKAKLLELRAAISLHRLWVTQCKSADARERINAIRGWFTEGFASPDLVDAALVGSRGAESAS
jgi:predicted ATPase